MRPELDPRLAAACRAFADWHGGEWTIVRVEPSPEARTVAELSDGARAVIAKLGTDDRGAESFQRLGVLYSLDTRVLRVPEPLAWFAETRALLTARAAGARFGISTPPARRMCSHASAARSPSCTPHPSWSAS